MLAKKLNLPFKFSTKPLKKYFWEALNYVVGISLFCFGIYTLSVNTFWINYIGELTQGLVEVGFVGNIDGKSTRRTYHDTIWLNLTKNKKVYNNDTIATHESTTLEINLDNVKITLEENTLVRIKNINGKPIIRVARGIVSADVGEGAQLLVQTTMKKTEIQRGRYLLTSDNPPETDGKEAEGDIANGLRQAKNAPKAEGVAKEKDEEEQLREKKSPEKAVTQPQLWKLPTPADNAIFLVQRHGTILFGYKESCDETCGLTIFRDDQPVKEFSFKTNEQAIVYVSTSELPFGHYTWEFKSTKDYHKASFDLLSYSQQTMFEYLKLNRSFEILN